MMILQSDKCITKSSYDLGDSAHTNDLNDANDRTIFGGFCTGCLEFSYRLKRLAERHLEILPCDWLYLLLVNSAHRQRRFERYYCRRH